MSNSISVSRHLNASPERVWATVSDLPRMGELSPENTGGRWLGGATGPAIGVKFKGTNTNGSKSWSTTAIVSECEPNKAFGFNVKVGPINVAHWDYAIESDSAGGCWVTESWADMRGRFAKLFGGKASGVTDRAAFTRTSMEQTLEKLAEKLA